MKPVSNTYKQAIIANPRSIGASIIHNGTHTYTNEIKSIKIESTCINGKFFGVSYSQRMSVTFVDKLINGEWQINFSAGDTIQIRFTCGGQTVVYPTYYIDSFERDEVSGTVSAIGYDIMNEASNVHYNIPNGTYTVSQLANAFAGALGITAEVIDALNTSASFTAAEINNASTMSLRELITGLAEITGTFAYISYENKLVFRRPTHTQTTRNTINNIDKSLYYNLSTDRSYSLTGISSVNELNDTVSVGNTGHVQVLECNPFLTLISDTRVQTILTNILNGVVTTLYPHTLVWRGNPAQEIGDTIKITTKDNTIFLTTYLSETLEYNGGLKCTTEWNGSESESTSVNSKSINTQNKITKALVDKANGVITLLVDEVYESGIGSQSKIEMNANAITAEVTRATTKEGELSTRITQTAEGLAIDISEVKEIAEDAGDAAETAQTTANSALTKATTIEATVDGIETRVSAVETDVDNVDNRLTTAESTITQHADEIATKVSQITFNALKNRVDDVEEDVDDVDGRLTTAESTITQHATEISSKVSQTTYNTKMGQIDTSISGLNTDVSGLGTRVSTAESSITQLSDEIATKVSQSAFNALGDRVSTAESTISQHADEIATKVSQTAFNTLGNKVDAIEEDVDDVDNRLATAESTITQHAGEIATKVSQSDFNALDTRVTSAESTITQHASEIASKVSQTDFNTLGNRVSAAESTITQQAGEIATKVSSTDYNGNTIVSLINQTATTVKIEAQHIDLVGNVTFSMLDNDTQGRITTAGTDASTALSTANTAQTTATTAQTTANAAQTTADTAQTTADAAQTTASAAQTTANTANTNASNAVSIANSASSVASQAQSDVDSLETGLSLGTTTINGGCITTGTIKAVTLESTNYSAGVSGTKINLANGAISSKNFNIDSSGNANYKGTIELNAIKVGANAQYGAILPLSNGVRIRGGNETTFAYVDVTQNKITAYGADGEDIELGTPLGTISLNGGTINITAGSYGGSISGFNSISASKFITSNYGTSDPSGTASNGTLYFKIVS